MATDIIGSKLPADNKYGQDGSTKASSSYTAGKTKTPPNGDWQTRHVAPDAGVPPHPASRDVNANPKTVPAKTDYRKS